MFLTNSEAISAVFCYPYNAPCSIFGPVEMAINNIQTSVNEMRWVFFIWISTSLLSLLSFAMYRYTHLLSPVITFALIALYSWVFLICYLLDIAEWQKRNPVLQVWLWQLIPLIGPLLCYCRTMKLLSDFK